MLEKIIVAVMVVIVIAAFIWSWWVENHGQEITDKHMEQEK